MFPFELQSELASAPLADESSNSQNSLLTQLFKHKKTQSQTSSNFTSLPTTLQSLFKQVPKDKSDLTSLFNKQPAKDLSLLNSVNSNTSGSVLNNLMPDGDFTKKKVRLDHSGMSPSTQDEGNDDCRSPKTQDSNSKEIHAARTYAGAPQKTIYKNNKNMENLNKHLKDRRILQVASKKEDTKYKTEELVFKVECDIPQSSNEVRYMDREEIIKEDPMLLVYFYESHLQFAKAKDFCSASLKKLQV